MSDIIYLHDIQHQTNESAVGSNRANIDQIDAIDTFLSNNTKTKLITLDDGYKSSQKIIPIVEKYGISCIIFITTDFIDNDLLPYEMLLSDLLANKSELIDLDENVHKTINLKGKDTAYQLLHNKLKTLPEETRRSSINKLLLRNKFESELCSQDVFLNWKEVKDLSAHPLIEIGSHTVKHQFLPALNSSQIYDELLQSRKRIESILSKPVTKVSYPYGGRNLRISLLAKRAGYTHGYGTHSTNRFNSRLNTPRISLRTALSGLGS